MFRSVLQACVRPGLDFSGVPIIKSNNLHKIFISFFPLIVSLSSDFFYSKDNVWFLSKFSILGERMVFHGIHGYQNTPKLNLFSIKALFLYMYVCHLVFVHLRYKLYIDCI